MSRHTPFDGVALRSVFLIEVRIKLKYNFLCQEVHSIPQLNSNI